MANGIIVSNNLTIRKAKRDGMKYLVYNKTVPNLRLENIGVHRNNEQVDTQLLYNANLYATYEFR